jgi:hypothetical protein
MMATGIPVRAIVEALGHSEIGVTINTSTHVPARFGEAAAGVVDRVLRP